MTPEPDMPAFQKRENFLRGHALSGSRGIWAGKEQGGAGQL